MNKKDVGHKAMRRGRSSEGGALYFVTICEKERNPRLANELVFKSINEVIMRCEKDNVLHCRSWIVMPDHIHLLFELGDSLSSGKCVSRIKTQIRKICGWNQFAWERSFFDRQVREHDNILSLFLYIFLNPYRSKLIEHSKKWPYYHCCQEDWDWFSEFTNEDQPFPEWLQ